jgi:hypothetical protein
MAKHVISEGEEEASDTSEERSSEMIVDGEEASEPAAASTPTRQAKESFRIVTIEPPVALNPGSKQNFVSDSNSAEGHSGEVNTAATTAAVSTQVEKGFESDGNSAEKKKGEDNSANSSQQKSSVRNKSIASTAKKTHTAEKSDVKKGFKIPSICPPPAKPAEKQAAEADAVPSSSYKAILNAKINKLTPPAIPGIGPATAKLDCGSFYNTGDNRIRRSVYKENIATLTITSISFNPVSWECASCPSKHRILEGGDSGGGGGRAVIVLCDQNFPAVLPSAGGKCVAIVRIEHGTMQELVELIEKVAPPRIPAGTIFLLGSLTHLQREGLQSYSASGVKFCNRLGCSFPETETVLFIPPPPWVDARIRSWYARFWMAPIG